MHNEVHGDEGATVCLEATMTRSEQYLHYNQYVDVVVVPFADSLKGLDSGMAVAARAAVEWAQAADCSTGRHVTSQGNSKIYYFGGWESKPIRSEDGPQPYQVLSGPRMGPNPPHLIHTFLAWIPPLQRGLPLAAEC